MQKGRRTVAGTGMGRSPETIEGRGASVDALLFQSAPRVGRNAKGVVSVVWYMLVLICIPGWGYNHSIYHFAADCNILRLFSAKAISICGIPCT